MEAKDIIKWSILGFFILFFLTGLSLIIFAVTVPTPFGDYLTMKAAAFPVNYGIRIGLLILLLFIAGLSIFAIVKENNRLLTLLAILFVILFLVEFIMGIVYFTMKNEITVGKQKFSNGQQMMAEYGKDEKITQAFDQIQRRYACCGIVDYRDWFTSKWAAAQGVNNRVPTSCCKYPTSTCGNDMDLKNPMDFINILGCTGLNFAYDDKLKVVGGVGLALGFLNLFALLCCIIFCFCFNAARGLSPMDALKGEEPNDESSSSSSKKGRRRSSAQSTPGSSRRQPSKKALRASREDLNKDDDDDDDLPSYSNKDLLDKSEG